MKRQQHIAPILALALLLMPGCATTNPVVMAEQSTDSAYSTMEAFKKWEFTNRATLEAVNPDIEHYANVVRRNEKKWLQSARAETMAYKYNRTPENKVNMDTAVAVLREAMHQISIYMAQPVGGTH